MYGGLKPLSVRFIELMFERAGLKNIDKKCKFTDCVPIMDWWF